MQFFNLSVVEFYKDLGIQNQFISVEHPQANGLEEAADMIILSRMKNKLDAVNGLWVAYLHEILWSYHNTPHSTTRKKNYKTHPKGCPTQTRI